jgi:heme-degrading monooxygenase HmoA
MVVVTSEVQGMTREMYDGMASQLQPVVGATPGFKAHVAVEVPGGFRIIEIWESRQQAEAWYDGTIKPAAASVGLNPTTDFQEAHNVFMK